MDAQSASTAMMAIGTLFSASSQLQGGDAARKMAGYEAGQLRSNANNAIAASQRTALEERRKTNLLNSRVQAVAASSGGGATDPTVLNIMGDIAGQGEYNALTELYNGQSQADYLRSEANARIREGKIAQSAAKTNAFSTVLSGASSLYDKYGNSGPNKPTTKPPIEDHSGQGIVVNPLYDDINNPNRRRGYA